MPIGQNDHLLRLLVALLQRRLLLFGSRHHSLHLCLFLIKPSSAYHTMRIERRRLLLRPVLGT